MSGGLSFCSASACGPNKVHRLPDVKDWNGEESGMMDEYGVQSGDTYRSIVAAIDGGKWG